MRVVFLLCVSLNFVLSQTSHEAAEIYAKAYKKALPLRCNSNIVLNDLLNIADVLLYRYAVNDTKKTWVSKFNKEELEKYASETRKMNLTQICSDKKALDMLDQDIIMEHVFYFETGKLLFEYSIKKADCLLLQNQ
ncbi:hypothetical protein CCAL13119_05825 [Campylobacter sp. RM13119]|uniref:hypothetical protein n=1 Tax=Campylobacter californiensis TaxID=1032243 RepID=UPI0014740E5A|nr:hypothetical protein [Campylobacter sp. RM13119]MBE3606479.1 hypothetical protein [Campylobacter sp. RM13119]